MLASGRRVPASGKPELASGKPEQAFWKLMLANGQLEQAFERPELASKGPMLASNWPMLVSNWPVLASGRPLPASGKPELASGKPEQAFWKLMLAHGQLKQALDRPEPASWGVTGGGGQKDGRTHVRIDAQIPPVFYRTSSPFGAAAQKGEKISNLRRGNVTKYGVVQSKRRVSPTSPCGRVRTYVKEVENCDQMPFTPSKSDEAQSCTKFVFIKNCT